MAFDNVTFFEVNLPNEVFGTGRVDEPDAERVDVEADGDSGQSGGSKGKLFVAALVLAGVAIAVQRYRSKSDDEEEIEMAYEEPGVEVERTEP